MLKNSSSLNSMISYLQRYQYLFDSCAILLKTTCFHVSFTAYKNCCKLTKNVLSSQMASTFFVSEMSEIRNPTIKHISTGSLIHNYIYGRSLSGDPLSIVMPFCVTRAYASVNQHTSHLNLRQTVCLSVLI